MSWDRYFEGMHFKWEFLFTNQDMQIFEALSGDHNPIHNDVDFAKSKGFDRPIIYGCLLSSQISRLIGQELPDSHSILTSIKMDFLQPGFPSEKLIKNSSLVISLSGSSPLEATFYQKPAIVFGDVVYSLIPSIFKVNTLEQLPKLIEKAISSKVDLSYLNRFIDLIEKNTVNFDMFEFQTLFNKKFYYQGYLFDVEIDEEDIKKFLDEIKDGFRDITDYHVRKISENKEIKS